MNISNLHYVDHYFVNETTHYEIQKVSFNGLIGFLRPAVLHQV
jgi:hypothetical protein